MNQQDYNNTMMAEYEAHLAREEAEMQRYAEIEAQEAAARELIANSSREYLFFATEEAAMPFADYKTFTVWACQLCDYDGEQYYDDGECFVVARNEAEAVAIAHHFSGSAVNQIEEL